MDSMKDELRKQLSAYEQEHLLNFWDELEKEQRRSLAEEIRHVNFELVERLFRDESAGEDWGTKAQRATPPPAARLDSADNPYSKEQAIKRGHEALSRGEVAVVIVAGGQGTRLGFDHPKGLFQIGPVSGSSLFRILFEKVLATSRRYRVPVPLFLMTSSATHNETAEYLESERYFGLPRDEVHLFCQGQMPAVDLETGKLLLASKYKLALSPDGHGGMLAALAESGRLDELERRSIRHLFYCQVDNPLVPLCDPEFMGYHLLAGSELSTQVVAKQDPLEKVGNVAMVDRRMAIIEYSDLPDSVANKRNTDGSLYLWAGNTGIHAFDVAFLRRMSTSATALPFHRARKKVPYIDPAGELIEPEAPNALKFERFIFDLLPQAERAFVMEVEPAKAFAPVKNAPGEPRDTPETVQKQMIDLHTQWLTAEGATIRPEVPVEISPLFALDGADLLARRQEGRLERELHVTQPRFFC
jgi:UDP-N-acetylglucosamine/UDP-N-acetylgalactosamine diphosphorylase